MTLHLVRHATALDRSGYRDDDRTRPLSEDGRRQAETLARWALFDRVTAVVSSPAVRCVDTVAPLARRLELEVLHDDRLYEGHDPSHLLELAEGAGDVVVCSHGDLIPEALRLAAMRGATLVGDRMVEKGCTWSVEFGTDGRPTRAVRTAAP